MTGKLTISLTLPPKPALELRLDFARANIRGADTEGGAPALASAMPVRGNSGKFAIARSRCEVQRKYPRGQHVTIQQKFTNVAPNEELMAIMGFGATLPIKSRRVRNLGNLGAAKGGPSFSSESALVRAAVAQSPHCQEGALTGVLKEVQTPNGIADLVFYRLRRDWERFSAVGGIPPRWAYAFDRLPYRRVVDVAYVSELCGVSTRRARTALTHFTQLGLCRVTTTGSGWVKTRQLQQPIVELVAVEAKLRDWKRALFQAVRHLSFADYTWVLLDKAGADVASQHAEMFELRGVGLAALSPHGDVKVLTPAPRSNRIRAHDRWYVSSEVVQRITSL